MMMMMLTADRDKTAAVAVAANGADWYWADVDIVWESGTGGQKMRKKCRVQMRTADKSPVVLPGGYVRALHSPVSSGDKTEWAESLLKNDRIIEIGFGPSLRSGGGFGRSESLKR